MPLEEIEKLLRQKLAEARKLMENIAATENDTAAKDEAEDDLGVADILLRKSRSSTLLFQLKERALALEKALSRVEKRDPDYGFCVECGEKIPAARLIAVPETDLCVECAEALEKA